MFEVSWLPEALADLQRHFDFLNEKNPEAASRAVRAVLAAGASLAELPDRGIAISSTA